MTLETRAGPLRRFIAGNETDDLFFFSLSAAQHRPVPSVAAVRVRLLFRRDRVLFFLPAAATGSTFVVFEK